MFIKRLVVALGAKFVPELIREFVGKLNTLNAALLQKSAPRPALSCASDFAPIRQNVCADRIRETVSVVIGVADTATTVSDGGYNCIPAFRNQRVSQLPVDFLVDPPRRFAESRLGCRNHDRVGQIIAMKNNSATGPAAGEVTLRRMIFHVRKFSKIAE